MIKLDYTLDIEDWKQFQKDHLDHSKKFKRWAIFFRLFIPLFMMGYSLFFINFETQNWKLELVSISPILIFSLIWLIYFPKFKKWQTSRRAVKLLNRGNNKNMLSEHQLEITASHLKIKRTGLETKWEFNGLYGWMETQDYFYIYPTTYGGLIIPKQKIKDKKVLREAIVLVKSKIDKREE